MSDSLERLKTILAEVTDLSRAAAVLEWDQETYMPPGGVAARSDQLSTLQRLSHVRFTAEDVGRLLSELEDETSDRPFNSYEASLVRVTRRDYDQESKLPAELVEEVARASSTARPVWEKARRDADFKIFAPALEKNVELNRRIADALGYSDRPYDALIDRTEPGMTTDQLESIFAELKRAIVPLVADIARHADAVDDRVLYRGFEPAVQVEYALELVTRLGYDLERGRQDISTHPFSTSFGPGDVRITTRVSRDFFNECLFGSIHESGHAMYNQGIGDDIDRTPLWGGASPGVHESQSRLWENLVGRSHPFWRHFFPSLRSAFPEPLRDVHWSFVSFGVFPGYTLGNLIGAQLMEKIRSDIPDLDAQFEAGQFAALLGWLRKNVHRHGRKFTPNELLVRATGRPLTAAPWIAYVRKKFGALYGIKPARV